MALAATIFQFTIELSDVDRGVYETLELRVAQHPSETSEYMATRVLAYALEYTEGIEMTQGVSSTDEPAVVVRDLTGQLIAWIEVGAPDADRLHRATKLVEDVSVYTHRDLRQWLPQLQGKKIHRRDEIKVVHFERSFIEAFCAKIDRRTRVSLSVTEQHLYLEVAGTHLETTIEPSKLPES